MTRAAASSSSPVPLILALVSRSGKGEAFVDGLIDWRNQHASWQIAVLEPNPGDLRIQDRLRTATGVIATSWPPLVQDMLNRARLPTVGVYQEPDSASPSPWPIVTEDERAKAELATEHLLSRSPASLIYVDYPNDPVPPRRQAMLVAFKRSGLPYHLIETDSSRLQSLMLLAKKMLALPRPVGVICFSYDQALSILQACDQAKLRVPEHVMVLSCGTGAREASLPFPPLTAVEADDRRIGYQGAGLLRRVLAGENLAGTVIRVPPSGVSMRLSTDITSVSEKAVARAVRLMHLCLAEGKAVRLPDIAREAGLSSRNLQERFRKALGRTYSQEWLAMRLERARLLLRDSAFESVSRVASESGFSDSAHLSREMKKIYGKTPLQFRNED